MGWCSGTPIFDKVAAFVLQSDQPDSAKVKVLFELADALEDHDWDCQSDSAYYNHPIVQRVFAALHPDWFEDDEDEDDAPRENWLDRDHGGLPW